MSDELKPCPFCKNGANIKLVEYRPNCSGAVVCGQCGARGPKKRNDHVRGWKVKAIEAWNTRAERTCRNVDGGKPQAGTFDVGGVFRCSACGFAYRFGEMPYPFCPECGAKVVG